MQKIIVATILSALLLLSWGTASLAGDPELMIFCGAAFKKPMEEIVVAFQKKEGVRANATYAGTGSLFSQLLLTRQGDVFIAPSPDVFEKAREKGVIIADTVRSFAFVVPCINVQKGNPKNIRELKDLLKPGTKVAIGNPEVVYVGMLSAEIVGNVLNESERDLFGKNLVTFSEDFSKLAAFLVLRQVDAVIGFHFLEAWYPEKIETVRLRAEEVQRIGSARGAVISYTKNREKSQRFVDFLSSHKAREVFRKYHYFNSADEAFRWLGAKKPVGGSYGVPEGWASR